jgi:hypothetical protein
MGGKYMKNSTIVKIITICGIVSPLFWYFTGVMLEISFVLLIVGVLTYMILSSFDCLDNYDYPIIKKEYNIFYNLGRFFRWLDSKPRIVKPTKKNWRTPDNWDNEI